MNTRDQDMSDQEIDLLKRSTKKQKEEHQNAIPCKVCFLDTFKASIIEPDINYVTKGLENINFQDEQENPQNHSNFIPLTASEKHRLYSPWKTSIIIKLIGKKMGYMYLQNRLQNIWQLSEKINLIDLNEDYYLIKLTKTEIYEKSYNRDHGSLDPVRIHS